MKRLLLLFLLLTGVIAPAFADERILSFHSDIQVYADGTLQVTETIRVRAEGREIKRGIYRDFPTDYHDRFGNRIRVDFNVVGATRNGAAESWHTASQGNGVRVYMGQKEVYLSPGDYTYALIYRTNRQLGFFDDHDELYWNVTGNDWAFPIDAATCTVHLLAGILASELKPEGYTGPRGARGADYRAEVDPDGAVRFAATRPLAIGEGLTVVVAWPKGYIAAPTRQEEVAFLLSDNRSWVIALVGTALLLGYFLLAWILVGRDPEEGVIITRYEPPPGVSPATMRFVRTMKYDHKAFVAALVNLAVKGAVEISEKGGEFTLNPTGRTPDHLAAGEKVLCKELLGSGRFTLEQSHHARIGKALKSHKAALQLNNEKIYFLSNKGWTFPGILISLALFAGIILGLEDPNRMGTGFFLALWLTGWSIGVYALVTRAWLAWRSADSVLRVIAALFVTLFALPFVGAEIFVLRILATQVTPALPAAILAAIALNVLFHHLLKAPTRAGRRLLDQIEGFRQYLEVAEKDEMNFRNPPEKTPQLFERFLPYALALDVEQRWTERFAEVFTRLQDGNGHYRPVWYHGTHWNGSTPAGFAHALGNSLGSAVTASSTAPGSSSGSGGGGSSGGGGGGGGGGGW